MDKKSQVFPRRPGGRLVGSERRLSSMKANTFLKDIYPIALFILVLMAWTVASAETQYFNLPTHGTRNKPIHSTAEKEACSLKSLFLMDSLSCKDNFSQLLSKLETKTKINN